MKYKITQKNWRIFGWVALVSFSVPLLITTYVILSSPGKESVVFLEDAPLPLALFIFGYYTLLLGICAVWLIMRIAHILRLRNVNTNSELQHLNSQVNPHFFFNILNSLYGLVAKDSKKAQDMILQLSDMMRYSIYEGQKEFVTVAEEVAYIEKYIDLQQARYHKETEVKFETEILDDKSKVMPLLFIVLVENAFKHGVEQLRSGAFVHLKLQVTATELRFEVVNNFDPEGEPGVPGIGIRNLERRLALRYPKKHTLTLNPVANVHQAVLTLKL